MTNTSTIAVFFFFLYLIPLQNIAKILFVCHQHNQLVAQSYPKSFEQIKTQGNERSINGALQLRTLLWTLVETRYIFRKTKGKIILWTPTKK